MARDYHFLKTGHKEIASAIIRRGIEATAGNEACTGFMRRLEWLDIMHGSTATAEELAAEEGVTPAFAQQLRALLDAFAALDPASAYLPEEARPRSQRPPERPQGALQKDRRPFPLFLVPEENHNDYDTRHFRPRYLTYCWRYFGLRAVDRSCLAPDPPTGTGAPEAVRFNPDRDGATATILPRRPPHGLPGTRTGPGDAVVAQLAERHGGGGAVMILNADHDLYDLRGAFVPRGEFLVIGVVVKGYPSRAGE